MQNSIEFIDDEDLANSHLMAFIEIVHDKWGLNCNYEELGHAIHTLQLYVIKHMLQRLEAKDFSEWYDTP